MIEILAKLGNLPGALPGACAQGIIWGIMAIGVYITYRILDVADLTVDGSMGTGGAVCIMLLLSGHNVWFALFMALVAGLLTGLVTGLFHTFMGIPAILAGILTQLSLYSINLKIFGTELGCGIRATGANPNMSRAQGINTGFNTVLGLMISNGLVALAGALLAQYQGFADVSMGRGAIVIGLAAVIIGEVIFGKLSSSIGLKLLAVSIGAIVYSIVLQIVLQIGLNTNDLKLVTALIVALFLALSYLNVRKKRRPKTAAIPQKGEDSHA